ncbi:MAG: shikimate kinase [Vulcanococcus sp.]
MLATVMAAPAMAEVGATAAGGAAQGAGEAAAALLRQRLEGLNVYLVGMMGCGKSSAGQHLAGQLGYRFLDADSSIEAVAGRSIPEIFASDGEAGFRDLEAAVLNQIAGWHSLVVATGGGVVLRPENWGQMRQGVVVWLDAPEELLLQRLAADPTPRPLMAADDPGARLRDLLAQRRPLYAQADLHIVQDGRPAEQVAAQVLDALPSILKERNATPPEGQLQVVNEAGEVGTSIN